MTKKERPKDLRIDEVSYEVFKEKCQEFASFFYGAFLVSALVNFILQASLGIGDTTSIDEKVAEFHESLKFIEGMRSVYKGESDEELYKIGLNVVIDNLKKEADFQEKEIENFFDGTSKIYNQSIKELPTKAKENYELYIYFCEHVVKELLIERAVT